MNVRLALTATAALAVLTTAGCLAAAAPEFKATATTAALVMLAGLVLVGVLAGLAGALLARLDRSPDRASAPPSGLVARSRARHPGASR